MSFPPIAKRAAGGFDGNGRGHCVQLLDNYTGVLLLSSGSGAHAGILMLIVRAGGSSHTLSGNP
jgi:hypothetical protein